MAQRVNVFLVDDLDGSEAAETVELGLDGVEYEVDLSEDHATDLRNALSDYIEVARRINRRRRTNNATKPRPVVDSPARKRSRAVRAWAQENGYEMSNRGRIPSEITYAYNEAQGAAA